MRPLYVRSSRCVELSKNLECHPERARLVHGLVGAYGLFEHMDVVEPRPLGEEDLMEYHTRGYIDALKGWESLSEDELAECGLEDDCPPFKKVLEYARYCAGGSMLAARALESGTHKVAIHWDGGRHHAQKGCAHGFCYVNDIVLSLLRLLATFERVLYIDVDIHHCDAVQDAFYWSDRVTCISMHKHEPGFYPGTGGEGELGGGRGRGFTLNLPLKDGLRDDVFVAAFRRLAGGAADAFAPGCVVLQCGADGLAQDRVVQNAFGLTGASFGSVVGEAASWGVPLMVLGGGGYTPHNVARAWAHATGVLAGVDLPNAIPEHEDLMEYGPRYELLTDATTLRPDENVLEEVLRRCDDLVDTLRKARAPPSPHSSSETDGEEGEEEAQGREGTDSRGGDAEAADARADVGANGGTAAGAGVGDEASVDDAGGEHADAESPGQLSKRARSDP